MKLRLAFSTCPNDTFAFYALVFGKIPTGPYTFDLRLGDIQELNQWAALGEADLIKISSNAMGVLHPDYYLLNSGSALGRGCGPLWICRKGEKEQVARSGKVAIPGEMTTANLLLHFRAPHLTDRVPFLFSDILDAVLSGKADSGLLIHEQRFTYQAFPVDLIEDLGDFWEKQTGLPIPLGSIAASRRLAPDVVRDLEEMIRQSIQWAFEHPEETMPFVREHAAELEESVMRAHINLYVNEYSVQSGKSGAEALTQLFRTGEKAGLYPAVPDASQIMITPPHSV